MGGLPTNPPIHVRGVLMLGRHPVKTWSSTQQTVATSSAEAELYAMSEGASRGLGFKTLVEELGGKVEMTVIATDSSAAKAFASTRGLGRMRHLEVKDLWMQELARSGRLKVLKVRGDQNPADPLTKFMDRGTAAISLARGGFRVRVAGGRAQQPNADGQERMRSGRGGGVDQMPLAGL